MWLVLWVLASCAGCSRGPQVEAAHRRLLLGLVTATSAEDRGLLDRTVAEIESARGAGGMSDATARSFEKIIQAARAGRWEFARAEAYALRDAQEPTQEDLDRLKRREMPQVKLPPGKMPARGVSP